VSLTDGRRPVVLHTIGTIRVNGLRRGGAARAALFAVCLTAGCSAAIDPAVIEDAQTAARVRTALVNDPDLGGRSIEVRVTRGIASLTGRVRTPGEAERAVALARSVTGVLEVEANLQVGDEAAPAAPADSPPPGRGLPELPLDQDEITPGLVAAGVSVGWSRPRADGLEPGLGIGLSVRLGRGRGLGPAIAFDWISSEVRALDGQRSGVTRVRIRPVMAGVSYTFASDRVSVAPSIVGGYAFNSLNIRDASAAAPLPVGVANSFAWRAGVSLWVETTRRTAVNVSVGYLDTSLRFTVFEQGRLEKRSQPGDSVILRSGIVYKLF
jgi:hyperosmotically inducible protein